MKITLDIADLLTAGNNIKLRLFHTINSWCSSKCRQVSKNKAALRSLTSLHEYFPGLTFKRRTISLRNHTYYTHTHTHTHTDSQQNKGSSKNPQPSWFLHGFGFTVMEHGKDTKALSFSQLTSHTTCSKSLFPPLCLHICSLLSFLSTFSKSYCFAFFFVWACLILCFSLNPPSFLVFCLRLSKKAPFLTNSTAYDWCLDRFFSITKVSLIMYHVHMDLHFTLAWGALTAGHTVTAASLPPDHIDQRGLSKSSH